MNNQSNPHRLFTPRRILAGLLLSAAALSMGCAGADPDESTNASLTGAFGRVVFHVHPVSAPKEGDNEFLITLEEIATGTPLEGATITVHSRMPTMGHSAPVEPDIKEIGKGAYDVSHVVFSMPGAWEVHYQVSRDELMDEASFPYDVR